MYTELKSYQIIIALLKKFRIHHCVLSAGSRNVPFVHSVEKDPFFKCYSIVDERSAGYFALGLAQQVQEPVVISCTASTASCNYWPPVAEAFYQGVPLVILTSDRDTAMLGQWEDQMIDQVGMFDRHVRKSVNLPEVKDEHDWIFCQRLVNEALLELNHHGKGPVHINIPMRSYNNSFNVKKLPEVKKIERTEILSSKEQWKATVEKLHKTNRIMVIVGQRSYYSEKLNKLLDTFFEKFKVAICIDHMSNVECVNGLNVSVAMDTRYITVAKMKEMLPDIVISFGGNVFGGIKEMLRKFKGEFEHWSIEEDGKVVDMFQSITNIFECPTNFFFEKILEMSDPNSENDKKYYNIINKYVQGISYPSFEYSNIYAIEKVVKSIPERSTLHLSINDSIRITNFFQLKKYVKVFANIGTFGIDGCLSSLVGQSIGTFELSFLIIGDLSFFYDMNALRVKCLNNNVRILLINNHGGEEFYFNQTWKDNYSDLHTTARHSTKAEGWVKENDFIYLSAHDKETFDKALPYFMVQESDKPIFFEVFTEMKTDAEAIYNFFNLSRPKDLQSEIIRHSKEIIKKTIGEETAKMIASSLGKKI